jgi:hypothetical protein
MSLFQHLPQPNSVAAPTPQVPAFRFGRDDSDEARVTLLLQPMGSTAPPREIWSHNCDSAAEAERVIAQLEAHGDGAAFFGRLLLLLGPQQLDAEVVAMVAAERERVAMEEAEALEKAAAHMRVSCYAPDKKGWFYLTLERDSASKPEWSIAFRGRAERERLRDWLRWQGDRYLEFLNYADEHGADALEKRMISEMFETEKRVKREGRGAASTRPLRMWRGE